MNTKKPNNTIAVVLLHGIGEQRPMATLRSFVESVFGKSYHSKPDRPSELFEVRRLDVKFEGSNVHCYELYWAHHMTSSTATHIIRWLLRQRQIPWAELKKMAMYSGKGERFYTTILRATLVASLFAIMVVFGAIYLIENNPFFTTGLVGFVVLVSTYLIRQGSRWAFGRMVEVVGDAARYLDSTPANVDVRQKIRAECVQFLRKLNEADDPDYSRIVVIGHSLGSVIAYDALKLLWAESKQHATIPATDEIEKRLDKLYGNPPDNLAQRELFNELQVRKGCILEFFSAKGRRWKISDFITVGSPLVHTPVLLTTSLEEFEDLKKQRELPTCPPEKDWDGKYCRWFDASGFKFHHAAVFAPVKWTNFFFPSDPIGGELKQLFGTGIDDIKLNSPKNSWKDHIRYWEKGWKGSKEFKLKIQDILRER